MTRYPRGEDCQERQQPASTQRSTEYPGYPFHPSRHTNASQEQQQQQQQQSNLYRTPAFPRYEASHRQSSPRRSVSPSVPLAPGNGYYPAQQGQATFLANGNNSPELVEELDRSGPWNYQQQQQPHQRDARLYHSSSHRSLDYGKRSPTHSFPPPQPSYTAVFEPDYHLSSTSKRREYEGRGARHSDSISSASSALSNPSRPSIVPSPPPPSRPYGSIHSMNAPPLPSRGAPTQVSHTSSSRDQAQGSANASISPPSGQEGSGEGEVRDSPAAGLQAPLADRKISCLECRGSKVKCSGQGEGGEACDRCQRIKRPCVFERHRRGRKPTNVKMHKLEQSVDTIMTALSALQEYKEKKEALKEMAEDLTEEQMERTQGRGSRKRKLEGEEVDPRMSRKTLMQSGETASSEEKPESPPSPTRATRMPDESMEQPMKHRMLPNATGFEEEQSATPLAPVQSDVLSERPETRQGDELETEAGQELGLPPLSNPLKLLAQASDSALDRGRGPDTRAATPVKEEAGGKSACVQGRTAWDGVGKVASRQRGASRREYWALGLYSSRYDKGSAFDPIVCQIMTGEVARALFKLYMDHLNAPITLLDPILSTFHYVRSRSALLLTSACALAARFTDRIANAEEVANRLDAHIQETLLPAVLLQGYRSVEISQAFIIMAAYHANTSSLDGDRSWSLLGYGIRIAAELDMNARIWSERQRLTKPGQTPVSVQVDTPSSSRVGEQQDETASMSAEEEFQRKMRNRERTWCNLWLFENSLSTHMGRRSTLGQDPVILGVSAGWHRAQYAIPGDEAIVAIISLRRLQAKNVEFFEHSVLSEASNKQSSLASKSSCTSSLRFQLEFYCNSCSADLNAWRAMYVEGEEGQSYRMKNARLYASYARLILNSYALKSTTDQDLLEPIYKESYSSAMTYLTLFSERLHSPELVYVHNSAVVTVAYVAVFALRLCSLDAKRYHFIDSKCVFDHVRRLAEALTESGSVTAWRNGAATSYAPYLFAVLQRVERSLSRESVSVDQGFESAKAVSHLQSSTASAGFGKENVQKRADEFSDAKGLDEQEETPSSSLLIGQPSVRRTTDLDNTFAPSLNDAVVPPGLHGFQRTSDLLFANSMPNFNPEALSFIAGPSGVEASTVLDELTNEDLQFGRGFIQDSYMDAGLFSDMSVFLNATSTFRPEQ